jgi:hypothetical protein
MLLKCTTSYFDALLLYETAVEELKNISLQTTTTTTTTTTTITTEFLNIIC